MITPIQKIELQNSISLFIKREDLIHPYISGNKYRKLKYNLIEAKKNMHHTIITYGGAFSNHILAVAVAGFENGFKTIGIIRGEELIDKVDENPTLKKAQDFGMKFKFVTRDEYRNKNNKDFIEGLLDEFGDFYLLPEGGTNDLAIKGCEEIIDDEMHKFDFICCAMGTGGTFSGLINGSKSCQKLLGFPALKGDFLQKDIHKFVQKENWKLITDYHFGGYGKVTNELIEFVNWFFETYKIPLDPVYTGKMVFGVFDLIKKKYFPEGSTIVLIHTGGLQGIEGMNFVLENKNLTQIKTNV